MQTYFNDLADHLDTRIRGDEVYAAWFDGEDSSFVRFNEGKMRQPGSVRQRSINVDLIRCQRHAAGSVTLSGNATLDRDRIGDLDQRLRDKLPFLPDDPHLLFNTEPVSNESRGSDEIPAAADAAGAVIDAARGHDLVGIYAAGSICKGFANSLGQRNWFEKVNFNLDWSLYAHSDKAVKSAYAGFRWNVDELHKKMRSAQQQLDILQQPARTLEPGRFRAYLAPSALWELFWLLGWGAFGLKSHRTKQTPLIKMVEDEAHLDASVSLRENTADGAGPGFQSAGFIKPERVDLIVEGALQNCLSSPRSAKEYGVETNGASNTESPEALDMLGGSLSADDVCEALGTGIYVNNLWYLNYSDRTACRVTGMTRFATFWVEQGRIHSPVNVMRFDDTLYRILGAKLEALTRERELILDSDTYFRRSTASSRLPGALIDELTLTL